MMSKPYHHGNLRQALITAGLEILSEQGIEGLSLRKVASRVGVSHTAPYNHFADKQALLAAISTAGHEQLFEALSTAFEEARRAAANILFEIAWVYLQFALDDPGRFKLMFSGALEEETAHPGYQETAMRNITLLEQVIVHCQEIGQLEPGPVEQTAISLWSAVHGFTYLVLEDQFPRDYVKDRDLRARLDAVIR